MMMKSVKFVELTLVMQQQLCERDMSPRWRRILYIDCTLKYIPTDDTQTHTDRQTVDL